MRERKQEATSRVDHITHSFLASLLLSRLPSLLFLLRQIKDNHILYARPNSSVYAQHLAELMVASRSQPRSQTAFIINRDNTPFKRMFRISSAQETARERICPASSGIGPGNNDRCTFSFYSPLV